MSRTRDLSNTFIANTSRDDNVLCKSVYAFDDLLIIESYALKPYHIEFICYSFILFLNHHGVRIPYQHPVLISYCSDLDLGLTMVLVEN